MLVVIFSIILDNLELPLEKEETEEEKKRKEEEVKNYKVWNKGRVQLDKKQENVSFILKIVQLQLS